MSYGFGRINDVAEECHSISERHGFWDLKKWVETAEIPDAIRQGLIEAIYAQKIALIHSEVSEALEALRKGDKDNFEEELADISIRVFDLSEDAGFNHEQAIENKCEVNEARPHKHGKSF